MVMVVMVHSRVMRATCRAKAARFDDCGACFAMRRQAVETISPCTRDCSRWTHTSYDTSSSCHRGSFHGMCPGPETCSNKGDNESPLAGSRLAAVYQRQWESVSCNRRENLSSTPSRTSGSPHIMVQQNILCR